MPGVPSGLDELPPSPGFSHRASPVRDTSLAPDSTTQMPYDFDDTPEFRSTSFELVGALGNPAVKGINGASPNNNNNSTSNDSNGLYNYFPVSLQSGLSHPAVRFAV